MKRIFILLVSISICMFVLTSCGEDNEQKINELQHQIQIEKQAKEIALQHAAKSESNLNLLIGLSIAIGVLALIIGVAMGSKTRKDANKQSIRYEGKSDD